MKATPISEAPPTPGFGKYRMPGVKNFWVVSEAPRLRLINWRRTTNFQIALPWVHYKVEYYPEYKQYWLWEVYFSQQSLSLNPTVCYPFLPNFYKSRPCAHKNGSVGQSLEEVTMKLWMGSFNWDGELAKRSGWQQIAKRAKVPGTKRRDVLEYWDSHLGINDVLGLYYPAESMLKVVKHDE